MSSYSHWYWHHTFLSHLYNVSHQCPEMFSSSNQKWKVSQPTIVLVQNKRWILKAVLQDGREQQSEQLPQILTAHGKLPSLLQLTFSPNPVMLRILEPVLPSLSHLVLPWFPHLKCLPLLWKLKWTFMKSSLQGSRERANNDDCAT